MVRAFNMDEFYGRFVKIMFELENVFELFMYDYI